MAMLSRADIASELILDSLILGLFRDRLPDRCLFRGPNEVHDPKRQAAKLLSPIYPALRVDHGSCGRMHHVLRHTIWASPNHVRTAPRASGSPGLATRRAEPA